MKGHQLRPRAERPKILLLGGSSFVGQVLRARLGPERAVATYHRHPIPGGVAFDATTTRVSDMVPEPDSFSHGIILLGDTNPESCAADVQRSELVNVEGVLAVIEELVSWHIKPVFVSSEYVFDGRRGGYVETDPVSPILTYGKQKVAVEEYLKERLDDNDYAIIRLAKVYGRRRGDGTIFTEWLAQLEREAAIECAADQVFSPVLVDDVAEALDLAVTRDITGIFHLGGPQAHSRLAQLELLIAAVREYRPVNVRVIPRSIHDFPLRERRPLDVSMRPDKIVAATGIRLRTAAEVCRELAREAVAPAAQPAGGPHGR